MRKRLLEGKGGEAGEGAGGGNESVFCYVNSVFAPGLDEGVGALWRVSLRLKGAWLRGVWRGGRDGEIGMGCGLMWWQCFKTDDQLIVAYSMTPAFG